MFLSPFERIVLLSAHQASPHSPARPRTDHRPMSAWNQLDLLGCSYLHHAPDVPCPGTSCPEGDFNGLHQHKDHRRESRIINRIIPILDQMYHESSPCPHGQGINIWNFRPIGVTVSVRIHGMRKSNPHVMDLTQHHQAPVMLDPMKQHDSYTEWTCSLQPPLFAPHWDFTTRLARSTREIGV